MPYLSTTVKTIGALTLASVGIAIMSGGGAAAVGIGTFVVINALLVLGALVWA
jgi:hypothetical protein